MKKQKVLILNSLLFLFTLINSVTAEEESLADKFLSSPLIVLVVIILFDIIAFIYHKIRK